MRTDLEVPFQDKDRAKQLGAKWDRGRKTWFVEDLEDLSVFLRWMPEHLTEPYRCHQ
jgi:hypothetical protein